MANSDNVLTKLHGLLLYLIPQLGRFPRDQKFLLADRIENRLLDVHERCIRLNNNLGFRSARGILRGASSTEVHQGGTVRVHGHAWRPTKKPSGHGLFPASRAWGTNNTVVSGLVAVGPPTAKARAGDSFTYYHNAS